MIVGGKTLRGAMRKALLATLPLSAAGLVANGVMVSKELKDTKTMCEIAEELDPTPFVRSLQDAQDIQLPVAKAKGLPAPVADRAGVAALGPGKLTAILDNDRYGIAPM